MHTHTHTCIYGVQEHTHTQTSTPAATRHTATHSPHGTVLCLSVAAKKRPSRSGIPRGVRTVPRCSCTLHVAAAHCHMCVAWKHFIRYANVSTLFAIFRHFSTLVAIMNSAGYVPLFPISRTTVAQRLLLRATVAHYELIKVARRAARCMQIELN